MGRLWYAVKPVVLWGTIIFGVISDVVGFGVFLFRHGAERSLIAYMLAWVAIGVSSPLLVGLWEVISHRWCLYGVVRSRAADSEVPRW
jgi:hypothetical protein